MNNIPHSELQIALIALSKDTEPRYAFTIQELSFECIKRLMYISRDFYRHVSMWQLSDAIRSMFREDMVVHLNNDCLSLVRATNPLNGEVKYSFSKND